MTEKIITQKCESCEESALGKSPRCGECKRKYRAAAALRHYYQNHQQSIQRNRDKYARNRERILAACKANERVKVLNRERARAAYQAKTIEERRAYRRSRSEYFAMMDLVRRSRRQNAPRVERIHRKQIIERDKGICYLCGAKPDKPTLDHVVPLSRGGTHTEDNLKVACGSCNSRKGTKPAQEVATRMPLLAGL